MKVPFSYLSRQFKQSDDKNSKLLADLIIDDIKEFIKTNDYTLGKKLEEFEEKFAKFIGVKHALGVGSGTDALILSLKALNIGLGDEVITCSETFIATAGAIAGSGATPVFVDVNDEFTIDEKLIEKAITSKTKAIMPVYFTGNCPNMEKILEIAKKYELFVVEDSCCAIDANINGKKAGSFGDTGAFSFHPLKNLNVFSDGGMVTTNDDEIAKKIKLLRNHGLINRDEVEIFGLNSRLDTIQAVVALRMLDDVTQVTNQRIANAKKIDTELATLSEFIEIPKRNSDIRQVFHLYMLRVKKRDELHAYLNQKGIEAKIHYPIALPYQKCSSHLHYKKGDFPKTERDCAQIITLPSHKHLSDEEINYMIETIKEFYLINANEEKHYQKEDCICTK